MTFSLSPLSLSRFFLALNVLLLACSPALNWREFNSVEGRFSTVFPGKPKVSTREITLGAVRVSMSMTAAGQGSTLFAVNTAVLPAGSENEAMSLLQHALLTNTGMQLLPQTSSVTVASLPAAVSARARHHVSLRAHRGVAASDTGPTQLSAHLLLVENRVYQIVAFGDARLAQDDLETFFGAFKLAP